MLHERLWFLNWARIIITVSTVWLACVTTPEDFIAEPGMYNSSIVFTAKEVEKIRELDLKPLDLSLPPYVTDRLLDFYRFYAIDIPSMNHYFGTFQSAGGRIAAHLYFPQLKTPRGTVILIHGYMDHSVTFNFLIRALAEYDFVIAAIDLPGHGFSYGERGDIGDFSEYADALAALMNNFLPYFPAPRTLVGHSTGCSGILEYLHRNHDYPFDFCVLAAPLVRSRLYDLSKVGAFLLSGLIPKVRTFSGHSSSNKAYVDFMDNRDPMMINEIPLSWVKALVRWINVVVEYDFPNVRLTVIQGTRDKVVDYQYNIGFLKQRFPHVDVHMIKGAYHKLFNEPQLLRDQVFQIIFDLLGLGPV